MSGTINTIPASTIVSVVPSVISAGGTGLDLIELMLTSGERVPIGTVVSFPTLASVQSYFGAGSVCALAAEVYFNGYDGGTKRPGALLYAQYPTGNVGAYLRGGNISGMALATLQAMTGTVNITLNGTAYNSAVINLSSATSFSAAAALIATGIGSAAPVIATTTGSIGASFTGTGAGSILTVTAVTGVIHDNCAITGTGVPALTTIVTQLTGTVGGAGTYLTSAATTASSAAITATSTIMDITAVASGKLALGQTVVGSGITGNPTITAFGSGTGTTGTYTISSAQRVASIAITTTLPVCSYDSVSGAFIIRAPTPGASSTVTFATGTLAASLFLTSATGAVLSQGAIAAVPGTFMAGIVAITQNWATFETLFDPDNGSGNAQKQLFAAWVNSTGNRYAYLATDTDITPTASTAATASLGYLLEQANSSGTVPIYEPAGTTLHLASFIGGFVASLDFEATNGRATAAFRSQTGLTASVTNATAAANLIANGYNYYGAYATSNDGFTFFYPGQITGPFSWMDSFVNQIWLNNACQLALMTMLTQYKSIPYNPVGYGYIRAALADPINAALNFGAIRANVPLSAAQASEVNAVAGQTVDGVLSTRGWYLVIQAATALTRAARNSPTVILLYMDGQSVQKVNLSSILVQ